MSTEIITYESIEKWVKEKLDEYLGFDSTEMTAYLLSMETHHEMEKYLEELFGSGKKIQKFSETLVKKLSTLPRKVNRFPKTVKPQTNQKNNQKKKDTPTTTTATTSSNKSKQSKKQIGSFAEIEMQMRPGEPCECQATKHKLITNCLNCGKVICEQEGRGPCKFCQTPLFTNPANFSAHQKEQSEKNLLNAIKYKDTILGYQNTHAKRTIVYDDQEDYFENASNKWLSNEERDAVQKQEQEFKKQQQDSKRTTRISIDFVGRRIISQEVKPTFEKLSFSNNSNSDSSNNNSNVDKDQDIDIIEKIKYKSHINNNINSNKKEMLEQGESIDESKDIITRQYYGVEEDSIVLKSMKVLDNSSFKFRGIVEGFWKYYDEKVQSPKRVPNIVMYNSFLKMFKQRNCNYFIISPQHYSNSFSFKDTVIPSDVLKFSKALFNSAKENNVTLNIAIVFPRDFVFGDDESVDFIKSKLENYRQQIGVNDFSLILPSGFNDTFTQPIVAPNSTKSEVNNSKTYSQTQTYFLTKLHEKTKSKPFNNIMVCPSIFEMNLLSGSTPPSRQQIEYWLEINRATPSQYPILFTTIQGSLQNDQLVKIKNIFDKRDMVVIEKYPFSSKKTNTNSNDDLNIDWDPYRCEFADHKSQLAGVLASPFDKEFHIDNMSFVLTLSTFTQYLQSPFNYQAELSLRTNLIDLMGNEELAEDFSDVILALSNGIFKRIQSVVKSNPSLADSHIDPREKLFFTDLIEKSQQVYSFFTSQYPNDLITKKLDIIISVLSNYIGKSNE